MEETYREGLRAALTEARAEPAETVEAPAVASDTVDASAPVGGVETDAAPAGGQGVREDGARPRDATGKFLPKAEADKTPAPKAAKPTATVAPVAKPTEVSATPVPPQAVTTPAAPKYRPPSSWSSPELRAKWAALPEEVQAELNKIVRGAGAAQSLRPMARERWHELPDWAQEEFNRVERETKQTVRDAAESRKLLEIATPYQATIQASGLDAPRYFQGLLQNDHALRVGTPTEKAKLAAQFIKNYQIPIDQLDGFLAGETPRGGPSAIDPVQLTQQIKAELRQEMEQQKEASWQTEARRQAAEMAETREFWDDIKLDMKALLTSGRAKDLESAYSRALLIHKADPESEVGKVLRQREAAEAATANSAATQRARAAATSVKSEPTGLAPSESTGSYRDELRRQMAERKSG